MSSAWDRLFKNGNGKRLELVAVFFHLHHELLTILQRIESDRLATPRQLGGIAEIKLQRLAIRSRDINFFFFRINLRRSHLISAGLDRSGVSDFL